MSFSIDRQSMDELNLLGKFRTGSVYHLFNQVKSRKGEQLLEQMFRNPLQDDTAINRRSSIFQFFQEARLKFPFDVHQFALMDEFLDEGPAQSAVFILGSTGILRLLAALAKDERYKKKVQALQATIVTIKTCYQFIEQIEQHGAPLSDRLNEVREILKDKQLVKLGNIDIYQSLSLRTQAELEYELKGRLALSMKLLTSFIAELDVYIAVSDVSRAHNFSYARALPKKDNVLTVKDLRHPCISGAVGNGLSMDRQKNVIFLTGANMAGKSTLMKSVGIVLYLAHLGFPVAAAGMEFSIREGLYSSINVADNISLGYSHFFAEVVRVKQAASATATGKSLLLMFDELFKGTNVKDAYDGTLAVTEAFAEYHNCLFIVSTHIIEVGEALKQFSNIQFRYMPTIMEGAHPRYTYEMQEGITSDRQGMMIIRNERIIEMIGA